MTTEKLKNMILEVYDVIKQPSFITGVFITLSMAAIYFGTLFLRTYEVSMPQGTQTIYTFEQDAYEVLQTNHIEYMDKEFVTVNYLNPVQCNVNIAQANKITVFADNEAYTAYSLGITVSDLLEKTGLSLDTYDTVSIPLSTYIDKSEVIQISRITVQTITRDEVIPSPVVDRTDPDAQTEPVTIEGQDGLRRVTVFEKYKNGVLVESTPISEEIITEASATLIYNPTIVTGSSDSRPTEYLNEIIVEATAYTATGNFTATGKPAQVGYVAVDPRYIPLGTKLYIESLDGSWVYGYAEAQDVGGGIKGYKIDLYMNTREECIQFGRRNLRVFILS